MSSPFISALKIWTRRVLLLTWLLRPDTDHILTPGVNEVTVFTSRLSCWIVGVIVLSASWIDFLCLVLVHADALNPPADAFCLTELYTIRWCRRKSFLLHQIIWARCLIVSGCFTALKNKWKAERAYTLVPLVHDGKQPLLPELQRLLFFFCTVFCCRSEASDATWGQEGRRLEVDHVPYLSVCVSPRGAILLLFTVRAPKYNRKMWPVLSTEIQDE